MKKVIDMNQITRDLIQAAIDLDAAEAEAKGMRKRVHAARDRLDMISRAQDGAVKAHATIYRAYGHVGLSMCTLAELRDIRKKSAEIEDWATARAAHYLTGTLESEDIQLYGTGVQDYLRRICEADD